MNPAAKQFGSSCSSDFMRLQRKVNPTATRFLALIAGVLIIAVTSPLHAAACVRDHVVIAQHPHDIEHFTQGLLIHDARLYESVGGYGRSAIHAKELRSARTLMTQRLPPGAFGEGLAIVGEQLLQLTWREQVAYRFDLDLRPQQMQPFPGEGWGLASWRNDDGQQHLVATDGSSVLRHLDPQTLSEHKRVSVRDGIRLVPLLNELEYVRGELLANIWHSDRVAVIDPDRGEVRGWFDFSDLQQRLTKPASWNAAEHVLNGMALDPQTGHLFVTGKQWPSLFEVRLGTCKASPDARQ